MGVLIAAVNVVASTPALRLPKPKAKKSGGRVGTRPRSRNARERKSPASGLATVVAVIGDLAMRHENGVLIAAVNVVASTPALRLPKPKAKKSGGRVGTRPIDPAKVDAANAAWLARNGVAR